jgi:hypothetical protein
VRAVVARGLAAAALAFLAACGSKADAGEITMDTSLLRDSAAGEVVLDSEGRPVPIYRDANEESEPDTTVSREATREEGDSEPEARSRSGGDDDSDRPRRGGKKKGKGKGKGKKG